MNIDDLKKLKRAQIHLEEGRYKHQELTEKIIGVFYAVYNELGHGFLESVYEAAFVIALGESGVQVKRQIQVPVWYHNQQIGDFRADLLVEERVLVELKAVRLLETSHEIQLLNYLKATTIEVGLLLNFGSRPQVKRLAFDNERKKISVHLRSSAAGL